MRVRTKWNHEPYQIFSKYFNNKWRSSEIILFQWLRSICQKIEHTSFKAHSKFSLNMQISDVSIDVAVVIKETPYKTRQYEDFIVPDELVRHGKVESEIL